ncbi:uncharacterized protein LOC130899013 [Diorhabda carinulata]|uniref:uncharacterized protein LOC130899013 n=1 Tax=Diorhabda carinulata TaxID=1163345 RepID=UPI0025A0ADDF|nr:uncharacterized protein LOC130899013 [Diorhabda carinulata]
MKFIIQDNVKMFYPTAEECKVNNKVHCTEEGCTSIFISESNLNLHLTKTHRKPHLLEESITKHYFCPELGCLYNADKYFKELKKLRTHYMTKHSSEQYICLNCNKIFPQQKNLQQHSDYCGVNFTCPQCPAYYATYESLQTHSRRKKHCIPLKTHYKVINTCSKSDTLLQATDRPILPKSSFNLIIVPNDTKKFNQESQTYNIPSIYKSKMTQVCREFDSRNNQQTQTGNKSEYFTVETQTIGNYRNLSRKNSGSMDNSSTQRSLKTQTDVIESKNFSCNTSFKDDFPIETNSSSTQTGENNTSNNNNSTHTHDTIYTDTSDLLQDVNVGSFEFDNCNMETQTDFIFDDVMFGCDYMSNMYTQTSDQILSDLGFSNIQTQTLIDDVLKSVESQTVMSRRKQDVGDRDMTHMETQTDMEFREMLEVINS